MQISVLRPEFEPDKSSDALANTLSLIFGSRLREWGRTVRGEGPHVTIVPVGCHKEWLLDLLSNVDRSDEKSTLYLSINDNVSSADHAFAGIEHVLTEARLLHAIEVEYDKDEAFLLSRIVAGINRLVWCEAKARPTRNDLLTALDKCLPGGLEGLLELSLRLPDVLLHEFLRGHNNKDFDGTEEKRSKLAACLLGISASVVGDLQLKDEDMDVVLTPEAPRSSVTEYLQTAARFRARLEKENPSLCTHHFVPLRKYFSSRSVVIVEDQLEYGWNELLPRLLGTPVEGNVITLNPPGQQPVKCAGITWRHFKNLGRLLDKDREESGKLIEECDIILLDLFSSHHSDRAVGMVAPTVKRHLVELQFRIASVRMRCDPEAESRSRNSLPQCRMRPPVVLAFTAANSGITTRTMLQEISIDDIFYKQAQSAAHRRLHYYSLRQSIISALERRAAWISCSTESHFQRWVRQFDAAQRPVIIKAMEKFRHYSAASVLRLASSRIENGKWLNELNNVDTEADSNRWISYLGRINKSGPAAVGIVARALDAFVRKKNIGKDIRLKERIKAYTYDELLKKLADKQSEEISLILVDDFVGSGGQVASNLRKFCHTELFETADFSRLRIELWFALGLDSSSLRDFLNLGTGPLESGHDYPISMKDVLKGSEARWLKLMRPSKLDDEVRLNNISERYLGVNISLRIEEVVPQIDFKDPDLDSVLKSRTFITGGREFELPCQFEPFGWKKDKGGGGLISTFANVPANTLPIIWASGGLEDWIPLRDRFFNPFDAGQMEETPPCLTDGRRGVCHLDRGNLLDEKRSEMPDRDTLDLRKRSDLSEHKNEQDRMFDIFRREAYAKLACRCARAPQSVSQKGGNSATPGA